MLSAWKAQGSGLHFRSFCPVHAGRLELKLSHIKIENYNSSDGRPKDYRFVMITEHDFAYGSECYVTIIIFVAAEIPQEEESKIL